MPFLSVTQKILLFAIAVVLIITGCTGEDVFSSKTLTVVHVSDFGAKPDDGKDDTPAIRAALHKIQTIKGKASLSFAAGTYDFYTASATDASYPVTAVHKQWDFVTPFHLNGLENLTIDGGGSTFVMHGRMTPFVLNACKNIKVMRLSIEHERPSVFELKVVAKGNSEIEYEAMANDQFVIEDNSVVWLDADNKLQIPNVCQYYDPVNDITRRCPDPLKNTTSITRTEKNRIRAHYEAGSSFIQEIQAGDVFQFRNGIRNQSGVVVFECENIAFEDMNVYSWNGLGFVCQFCRDLTFKNLRMEPNPDSKRTNAGFADAIQILASQGEILIENSRFVGLHDDHINIYGQMMKVAGVDDQGVLEAVFTSNETEGFLNFRKGDRAILRNPNTLEAEGEFEVVESELLDDKTMRIGLDGDISEKYQDYWIENLTWIPDKVSIRGNYFGRVPTRSILMYVAREAIIENNTFHRIPMASILIQCPDQRWALQNHVEKLTLRNNVFYECESALIRSNPQVQGLSLDANLYGTIDVMDNLLIMREKKPVFLDLRGFSKVNVGTNRIELAEPHSKMASFKDCGEISLLPQMILGIRDTPKVELKRVTMYTGAGWEVDEINEQLSARSTIKSNANKPYVTPQMHTGEPEPGKRVKVIPDGYAGTNVYHSLYLPEGHTTDKQYPVIVEYTGNYAPGLGSSGQVKDASLGYATARALGAIWVVMPYLSADGRTSELTWWGSETKTIDYCARQLKEICMNYGGDPSAVFIIGFSRGAIAVNRLGLNDDRASDIWLGFHSHDHFDGQFRWSGTWANSGDYEAYKADAAERAKRYNGRAALVGGEEMDSVASYLSSTRINTLGKLRVLSVPVAQIIPPEKLFVNPDKGQKITHTDKWMNYDSPEADEVVQWYKDVIKNKPGTYCIHGTVSNKRGKPMKGVLVETGKKGVDYKGIYTHFSITDSKGAYKLEGLTGGKRIVMVKEKIGAKQFQSKKVDLQFDEVLNFIK